MPNEMYIVQVFRVRPDLELKHRRKSYGTTHHGEELMNTFYFYSQTEIIEFREAFMQEARMRGRQNEWKIYYSIVSEFKPYPGFIKNTFNWYYGKSDPLGDLLKKAKKDA